MTYVSGWSQSSMLSETSGASTTAQDVARQSAHALLRVRLGRPEQERLLNELRSTANEHGLLRTFEGLLTFNRSVGFLASLPPEVAQPDVSVDPDGEVSFDWAAGDDLFSISLGPSGRLTYAADIDGDTRSGVSFFGGSVPEDVLAVIGRFR